MTSTRLVLRNFSRNRLRTILTAASVALSIFLVCAVLTLPQGFRSILDRMASTTRISVHNKAGITYFMPYGYLARIRAIPGVAAAASFSWFGGIYDEPKNLFPNFAVDVDAAGEVWPDFNIAPTALADFRRHRDGARSKIMQRFPSEIGGRDKGDTLSRKNAQADFLIF